jgi:hypothetical protein
VSKPDAGLDFLVKRDAWRQCRVVQSPVPGALETGQALFRVEHFAFTSNNVTYAVAGDMLDYWGFFPAETGWGRLPTMGFGRILRSRHPDVVEGQRFFGFYPMSTHLVVQAEVNAQGLVDAVAHRSSHAPAYRQYTRTDADRLYHPGHEDRLMLLRGLFMTSFLVDDFLADNAFFDARSVVISSASSKTAIALAWLLARRPDVQVIGLTSPANAAFVKGLGFYDTVLPYGEAGSLPAATASVFVDHSGDGDVVNSLHRHLGDALKHSCIVGATHWDAAQRAAELPGAPPTFFFAPAQMQKRSQDWGPEGFQERLGEAWAAFRESSEGWLTLVRDRGPAAVERVYREVLEGRARPDRGHVLSMWENEA